MSFFSLFLGDGGLTKAQLGADTRRNKLSDYLPYVAWDPDSGIYLNTDGSLGVLWECTPLIFAGDKTNRALEGLFRVNFPPRTIIQFILHADPHIDPILERFKSLKTREIDLFDRIADTLTNHFREGAAGQWRNGQVLRTFRCFVAVKWVSAKNINIHDIVGMAEEALSGAALNPRRVEPPTLLEWLRRLLNDNPSGNLRHYDDTIPIRRQALFAETISRKAIDHITIGKRTWRCLTPKGYPPEVNAFQTNQLFGGVEGGTSDADQIPSPFVYCLNILLEDQKTKVHTKCNFILMQQGVGSWAPSLARKKEEYLWATDEIEKGVRFYKIIPILWVYDSTPEKSRRAVDRARRLWEGHGYLMQEDRIILPALFISALPFGLFDIEKNIELIDRDYIVPAKTIAEMTPVQGDFMGTRPMLLFSTRKGQVAGIDMLDRRANNHNGYIAATTGSGKSFLVNYMLTNYHAAGAKNRVIDIGGSYKKMSKMCGARYMDFTEASDICINPFTNIVEPEHDIPIIAPIVTQAAFSTTNASPSEAEATLIKNGVRWAWEREGLDAGFDHVQYYLRHYEEYGVKNKELKATAEKLAFYLEDFTSQGPYGRFFNGRSTFNIKDDEFVVLELEHLERQKELFKPATLQIINAVTKDLYLSDRKTPQFILVDEAWKILDKTGDYGLFSEVIKEGYRRARKYEGSFTIITQSVLDLKNFGPVGDVILGNSAFKFFLESGDYERAFDLKILNYDPFVQRMLKSVTSRKPHYSEIFIDSPFGVGVVRLTVDPFSYYAYTSDGAEIAEIEDMVKEGRTYAEAIHAMVATYRSN